MVEGVVGSHVAPEEKFDFFWRQQGEWVEEPNRRRGGESGVQRVTGPTGHLLYSKRQTGQFIYDLNCILDVRKRKCDVILQLGYTSGSVWGWLLPKNVVVMGIIN